MLISSLVKWKRGEDFMVMPLVKYLKRPDLRQLSSRLFALEIVGENAFHSVFSKTTFLIYLFMFNFALPVFRTLSFWHTF